MKGRFFSGHGTRVTERSSPHCGAATRLGYRSSSEADLALCSLLASWTNDPAHIDSLFRQSALFRPKWDERRGDGTYGDRTILRAIAGSRYNHVAHSELEQLAAQSSAADSSVAPASPGRQASHATQIVNLALREGAVTMTSCWSSPGEAFGKPNWNGRRKALNSRGIPKAARVCGKQVFPVRRGVQLLSPVGCRLPVRLKTLCPIGITPELIRAAERRRLE
jgi:hypothetical protein